MSNGLRGVVEKAVERGSWLAGFNTGRVRFNDGFVVDYVEIDPELKPTKKRVWLFFWQNVSFQQQEIVRRVEQMQIADWRRRQA